METCPYCPSKAMKPAQLRAHFALDICGMVPPDTALAFPPGTLEDAYRKEVEAIASEIGWLVYHPERCRGKNNRWLTTGTPGFPDDIFVWPTGGVLVVEFKADDGAPTKEQVRWVLGFDRTEGVTARVFGPPDWPTLQRMLLAPLRRRPHLPIQKEP